jgi:hypothetical protein
MLLFALIRLGYVFLPRPLLAGHAYSRSSAAWNSNYFRQTFLLVAKELF